MLVISSGNEVKDTELHPGLCACDIDGINLPLHSKNFLGEKKPDKKKKKQT